MVTKAPSPLKHIRDARGSVILVKLKDGSEYIGKLEHSDATMNLILSDCIEVKEGTTDPKTKYGVVLIRGSTILYISVDYEKVMRR